jgi:hypothetical protein
MLPSTAHAQSAIGGTVKDTTGAVLPGVTVEAASPVLIEKSKTVVTDAEGNYKIVDLRPGTYVVTFSLEGFATVKREGLELPSTSRATRKRRCCRATCSTPSPAPRRFKASDSSLSA